MFSLFPPTFKNRPNGMRVDIAETLVEMGPKFFRFPGGNNLEGQTTATRWQWNATVGSLLDRPGRVGDWGYVNTDGLGLLEYLQFFEDADMEPIMAVWSGKPLQLLVNAQADTGTGYSLGGTSLPESQLAPYIQQAVDQINFVIGEAGSSAPASLRASLGHPEPFTLHYVEVGNEDFFAANTYPYRWRDFVGNLSAKFPQLTFIATSDAFDPVITPNPLAYDVHVYQTPCNFERNATKYFEGEYAAISTNPNDIFGSPSDGRLSFPTVQSASGEAAFMTGLERNSDIVFAASYAPLLQHVNSTQWTPDLVSFEYAFESLSDLNKGDEYIPSTLPTNGGTVHWSVTRITSTNTLNIKVANAGSSAATVAFTLPFGTVASTGTLQQITGPATASNTPEAPNTVVPVTSTISTGKTINLNAPAFSVSLITVVAH
ncbi:hypothetical protein EIP86_008264 [Pleurotus ostreatoroseus]|nr:hypothetical protein EIP86_008264 [Pleurotus ostreatoroseus]